MRRGGEGDVGAVAHQEPVIGLAWGRIGPGIGVRIQRGNQGADIGIRSGLAKGIAKRAGRLGICAAAVTADHRVARQADAVGTYDEGISGAQGNRAAAGKLVGAGLEHA